MTDSYNKLKRLLAELFQFDREDLDFGIYRIMNHKRDEVSRFLNQDLLPQVRQAFGEYREGEADHIREQMVEIEQAAARFNADPEENDEYRELKARLAETEDLAALENDDLSDVRNGGFESVRRQFPGGPQGAVLAWIRGPRGQRPPGRPRLVVLPRILATTAGAEEARATAALEDPALPAVPVLVRH